MTTSLLLASGVGLTYQGSSLEPVTLFGVLVGGIVAMAAAAVTAEAAGAKRLKAGKKSDEEGNPKVFTLSLGAETVVLEPGKSWNKLDVYKWVTRGVIEDPRSFHIHADGAIAIAGENIRLSDPEGTAKLEREIHSRHAPPVAHKTPATGHGTRAPASGAASGISGRVQFKVRLDHLGHLMVECFRRNERVETGIRGLPSLVENGLMLKPKSLHVDPLLRGVDIDDTHFESNEAGARQLEEFLNSRYAPALGAEEDDAVEIKENPAAATGFDIRFVTIRAGARFEIKGHLSQDKLDVLQDTNRCEILQPGTVLRLSPPCLLFRRRRRDSSEEKIPELPDVQYRRVTAGQLQRMLNHPVIRRLGEKAEQTAAAEQEQPVDIIEIRVVRNPQNKLFLWLECVTTAGGTPKGSALTHHNISELQHHAVFLPHLEVALSVDNRTLRVLNKESNQKEVIAIDQSSPDADLGKAGLMLTAALKPPVPRPATEVKPAPAKETPEPLATTLKQESVENPSSPLSISEPAMPVPPLAAATAPSVAATIPAAPTRSSEAASEPSQSQSEPPKSKQASNNAAAPEMEQTRPATSTDAPPTVVAEPAPPRDQPMPALFHETDPLRINAEAFRKLGKRLGPAVQDICLDLPRVFANRRFEIISFSHPEITEVLELRLGEFVGFYLTHINDRKTLLNYACKGKRVEFGPERCLLQPDVTIDPDEFKGSALLGLAFDRNCHYVFIVTQVFKDWVNRREKLYLDASIRFATVAEIAAAPTEYTLIWPEPPAE